MKKTSEKNTETMKTLSNHFKSIIGGLAFVLIIASCDSNPDVTPREDLLPQQFRVDIPSSLSNSELANGRVIPNGRVKDDTVRGNDIYELLGVFIEIGDEAGELVEEIINGVRRNNIDRVITLTYISDDDNREKNLVVVDNSDFEGRTWDYQLTVTDADSEGEADGGKAMQVFWNVGQPVEGIAILKPFNIDRVANEFGGDAIFRIDYAETGEFGYEAHMEVQISGLPLPSPLMAQMLLFRIQAIGSRLDNCDYVITAVRPRHTSFYKRFMNFEPISDELIIEQVAFPIQLLSTPVASSDKLAESSSLAAFEEADLGRYKNCLLVLQDRQTHKKAA